MKRIIMLLGAGILLLCSMVYAAVPQLINFQGVLRDGSGNPVANGSYSVVFTIYDAPTAGTNLWSETQSVNTVNGLFTVLLGSGPVPLVDSIFNDSTRWLGVKVGGDAEMTPRQRLSSVGYSYVSSQWTSSGENLFRVSGNVGIGTTTPNSELEVAGTIHSTSGGIKFPDGTTKSTGTLDGANMVRSNGGSGSGSNVDMLTLTVDLTGMTGKWIHVYGGTAIAENNNTANTAIVRLIISNSSGSSTTISALRQGISVYSTVTWDGNSIASLSTQGYFQITSAYAVPNVTIKLNGGIDAGTFFWGDQPAYTNFDGENAGAYLGYAVF